MSKIPVGYSLNDCPPIKETVPLSIQQIVVLVFNVLPVPLLIGAGIGLSASEITILVAGCLLVTGIATLLQRVREHHSLRAGAASMEMAYSKAWTVLRTAQEGLGVKLLRSSTGGRNGGGATLTAEGERLLAAYEDYCAKLTAYGETLFAETFAFYDTLTEEKPE